MWLLLHQATFQTPYKGVRAHWPAVAVHDDMLYTSCYGLLTLITLSHILPQTDKHNELSSRTHTLKLQALWITPDSLMLTFHPSHHIAACLSGLRRPGLSSRPGIFVAVLCDGRLLTVKMSLNVFFMHLGCAHTWDVCTLRSRMLSK